MRGFDASPDATPAQGSGNGSARRAVSGSTHNALHAWCCALRALGVAAPPWRVKREAPPLPPLLGEYRRFRKAHCGVSDSTLCRDIDTAAAFLALLRSRRRPIQQSRLKDVDVFVSNTAGRFSTSTVANTCSSLRAFLRFLLLRPADWCPILRV